MEEYLFDSYEHGSLVVLLYVDEASVVVGRHQNPWIECNVGSLEQERITLARRVSGGGTVFHDEGNLNFSFIMDKNHFNKERNLLVVVRALRRLGIEGYLSDRGDILVNGKKVSGNAQCFRRATSLHHGTLLVHADIDRLRGVLSVNGRHVETHAVASCPSPVANLRDVIPGLTIAQVTDALMTELRETFGPCEAPAPAFDESVLGALYARNASWDWIFGKTPRFSARYLYRLPRGDVTGEFSVEGGIIRTATFTGPESVHAAGVRLEGVRFDPYAVAGKLADCDGLGLSGIADAVLAHGF